MDLILEVGLNHFGKISESNKYLNFFLESNYKNITYQIQKESFYKKFKFKLSLDHYKFLIKKTHQKKNYLGLAVADIKSCKEIANLNFDFFFVRYELIPDKINFIFTIRFYYRCIDAVTRCTAH